MSNFKDIAKEMLKTLGIEPNETMIKYVAVKLETQYQVGGRDELKKANDIISRRTYV